MVKSCIFYLPKMLGQTAVKKLGQTAVCPYKYINGLLFFNYDRIPQLIPIL
jgi:hypothetical protein